MVSVVPMLEACGFERLQSLLRTRTIGRCFMWFSEVGSTMDVAAKAATDGCASGALFLAERQTQGRGRAGRSWLSSSGSLTFSVVLRTRSLQEALKVNLGAALAVCSAISNMKLAELEGKQVGVKWPNDVWVDGKKVCGLLVDYDGSNLNVGIGVNVNGPLDPAVQSFATSLGEGVDRVAVLAEICNSLEEILAEGGESLEPVITALRGVDLLAGREVVVMPKRLEDKTAHYTAVAQGITEEGYLRVLLPDGAEKLLSGEEVSVRAFLESMEVKQS